jgi:hypothetical protein
MAASTPDDFVLIVTESAQVAIVRPVEEFAALVRSRAGQEIALIVAVEVHLEGFPGGAVAVPTGNPIR